MRRSRFQHAPSSLLLGLAIFGLLASGCSLVSGNAGASQALWCGRSQTVEDTLNLVSRVDKGSPEDLADFVPQAVATLEDAVRAAPAEIQADVVVLAEGVKELERALKEVDWDVSAAEPDPALWDPYWRSVTPVLEYDADNCGVENNYGPSALADQVDRSIPVQDQSLVEGLGTVGFSDDEALCVVQALEQNPGAASLLSAYGYCGIAMDRFITIAGG